MGLLALSILLSGFPQGQISKSDPNIFVPSSSVALPLPFTVYNHTNYIINLGSPIDLNHQGTINGAPVRGPRFSGGSPPFAPSDIRTAYNIGGSGGGVIAIVDAYDNPDALTDFNTFSTEWGLPTEPSTTVTASTNAVFQVVYQSGSKPSANSGWAGESSLDIEWAHAMAPSAKIVLVEAANNGSSLYSAIQTAAGISGVRQISMSWGGGESSGETGDDGTYFGMRSIQYFAAAGDTGGEVLYPAASPNCVACGGTSLYLTASSGYSSESAWSSGGGGPSAYESRPSYQNGIALVGSHRGTPDIACVADPNTGVYVYSQYGFGGWAEVGGTSVATPVLSGMMNSSATIHRSSEWFWIYDDSGLYHDVTSGNNGYAAGTGYDFCTGIGTPKTGNSL